MILIVLAMLALPMGMVGWYLRGWQEEKAASQAPAENRSQEGADAPDAGLRTALENAAQQWQPDLDLRLPEVVVEVPPGRLAEARDFLLQWAQQQGLTLIEAESSPERCSWWTSAEGRWSASLGQVITRMSELKLANKNLQPIPNKNKTLKITLKTEN